MPAFPVGAAMTEAVAGGMDLSDDARFNEIRDVGAPEGVYSSSLGDATALWLLGGGLIMPGGPVKPETMSGRKKAGVTKPQEERQWMPKVRSEKTNVEAQN